jgi:hypothetical protein
MSQYTELRPNTCLLWWSLIGLVSVLCVSAPLHCSTHSTMSSSAPCHTASLPTKVQRGMQFIFDSQSNRIFAFELNRQPSTDRIDSWRAYRQATPLRFAIWSPARSVRLSSGGHGNVLHQATSLPSRPRKMAYTFSQFMGLLATPSLIPTQFA